MSEQAEVIVVGAGLAGLTCAVELVSAGVDVLLLEASDAVGGRVRTDEYEGFLLDHGFQVLLTGYPTAKKYLDYEALDLKEFYPGAIIRMGAQAEKMADPFRRPIDGLKTLMSPVGSAGDKVRIGQMRTQMIGRSLNKIYQGPGTTSIEWLREEGYSEEFITQFFKPFYGGVMLDRELETSHKMLAFTYKMFAAGDTSVPAKGMGQISEQLADRVGRERIRLGARVARLLEGAGRGVELESGELIHANQVVIATDQDFAREQIDTLPKNTWRGVRCVYFAAPESPEEEAILVLNGRDEGVVNNLCVMSQVSEHYAPKGQALVSVAVLGEGLKMEEAELIDAVTSQLSEWYGEDVVKSWRHLRTYDIPHGQPDQSGGKLDEVMREVRVNEGLFVCGDHRETASIEGAMHSGERAARAVLDARG